MMCEPYHSIVQFPTDDDGSRLGCSLGPLMNLGKVIKGFLNISKMGKGHSEALEKIRARSGLSHGEIVEFMVPIKLDYEVAWWNRTIQQDLPYSWGETEPDIAPSDALFSAEEYAKLTSIGSLQGLRQFLEQSVLLTQRPINIYLSHFRHILNKRGEVQFDKHYRSMVRNKNKKSVIAYMCGFTRKRNLLVPEWADDSSVWDAV